MTERQQWRCGGPDLGLPQPPGTPRALVVLQQNGDSFNVSCPYLQENGECGISGKPQQPCIMPATLNTTDDKGAGRESLSPHNIKAIINAILTGQENDRLVTQKQLGELLSNISEGTISQILTQLPTILEPLGYKLDLIPVLAGDHWFGRRPSHYRVSPSSS